MDAEHWLAVERRSIERDEWTAPRLRAEAQRARSKTLGEYATDWLETRSLKPRTKIGYEASYNNYIKGKLEDVPLSALNAETVRRWYAAMDKAKPTARAHAYQLLHAVCATALTDGLLSTNPCNLTRAMSTPTKRQPTILGVDEIAKLANTIEPQPRVSRKDGLRADPSTGEGRFSMWYRIILVVVTAVMYSQSCRRG